MVSTRSPYQVGEQVEFAGGQLNQPITPPGLAAVHVEHEIAYPEDVRGVLHGPPTECSDTRQQFIQGKWLDQVVVSSGVESTDTVGDRIASR